MENLEKYFYYNLLCLHVVEGRWEVTVRTSDVPGSGTGAQVSLTVYGRRADGTVANSGPQPLGQAGDEGFQQGQTATHEVGTV